MRGQRSAMQTVFAEIDVTNVILFNCAKADDEDLCLVVLACACKSQSFALMLKLQYLQKYF